LERQQSISAQIWLPNEAFRNLPEHALRRESTILPKVVSNGREALTFLDSASMPNLILLDLMMPVMSGQAFIDVKTNDPVLSRIPVCVLTGYDHDLPGRKDIAARLRKPIDSKSVIAVVVRHCQPMA
jgi:CheY-like chemotaxis protein